MIDYNPLSTVSLVVLAIATIAAGVTLFHLLMLWKSDDHVYHYSMLDGIFEFGGMIEIAYFILLTGIAFTGLTNPFFFAGSGVITWIVSIAVVAALNRMFVTRNLIVCSLSAVLSNVVALSVLHIFKQLLLTFAA